MKKLAKIALAGSLLYFMALPVLANLNDGLIAHYPFDGNSQDVSGNGKNATEYGGVTYTNGKMGSAAHFDGVDDTVTKATDLKNNIFSVSVWAKSSDDRTDPIVQLNDGDGNGAFQLGYGNNNVYLSQGYVGSEKTDIDTSKYNHLVAISDGTNLKLYINGIYSIQYDVSVDNANFLEICSYLYSDGSRSVPNYHSNSDIDELRIYNRVLTESEIQQLYQGENSCTTNGGFTQVDIDNAIEQGKQACINNPASCGITVSSSTPPSGDCMANYFTSGQLHVPCVSVPDAFGGITVYDIELNQQAGSFTFDLDMGSVKPK